MNPEKFMPTLIANTCEAFKQSLTSIVENNASINQNSSTSDLILEMGTALEEASGVACRSGLVELIENHDCSEESISRDGNEYRFKEVSTKSFLSRFGVIEVSRRSFHHWRGGPGIIPLDDQMEMSGRYTMPDVVEFFLYGAAMLTPRELEGMFNKINHFKPSASLIQDVINQDGQALDNFLHHPERDDDVRAVDAPKLPVTALVASFDGANLLVREPGRKRGAKTKKPGKDNNNGQPIEKSCSYKNAMVGSISFYNSVDADNIIDFETQEKSVEPMRVSSFYLGRMPEERYPIFKAEFERSLSQAECVAPSGITKILLMDGARGFWSYADQNPLYNDYIKLVDFYHSAEHLSRLAEALFGKSSEQGQAWFEKWLSKLKHESGSATALLRSAQRYRKDRKLSPSRIEDFETEITFFRRNKERMQYSTMVEQGLPIGSGPVEAACKMIVKARFCQSGMRWSLQGGQNVMNLRVIQKSDQWDETWRSFQNAGGYHYHIGKAA